MSLNPAASRLIWFAGIWLASVLLLGVVAYAIRLLLSH
jgi:hypothetical protein